jgi:hypothetical protein
MFPGNLLSLPFEGVFLSADLAEWEYQKISPGYLLCLDSMDVTGEWAAAAHAAATAAVAAPAAVAAAPAARRLAPAAVAAASEAAWEEYNKIYKLAMKEFEETGKIGGYKFLCPEGKNYIWLSHYDGEYLESNRNGRI